MQELYAYTADASTGATMLTIAGGHSFDTLCRILGDFADISAYLTTQQRRVRIAGSDKTIESTSPDKVAVFGRHKGGAVSSSFITGGRPKNGAFRLDVIGTAGDLLLQSEKSGDYQITPLTLTGTCNKKPIEPYSSATDWTVPGVLRRM